MIFNGTKHMIAYCMAILKNQGMQLDRDDVKIFNSIDYILDYLQGLKSMNAISYNVDDFYNDIVENIKQGNYRSVISDIRWVIGEIKKQVDGNTECGYVINNIEYRFKMDLCFTDDFIFNYKGDDIYPETIRALIKYDVTDKIQPFIKHGEKTKESSGVYFIYDKEGKIAYIGMSGTVDQRCINSATYRSLYDFTKIEIYSTKTRADALIYETYYIHKLKPYMNKGVNKSINQETNIILPDLNLTRTIEKSPCLDCVDFNYKYFKTRTINTECYTEALGDSIFINNKSNRDMLISNGYKNDEYNTRLNAYIKSVESIKKDPLYKKCHLLVCDTIHSHNGFSLITDVVQQI